MAGESCILLGFPEFVGIENVDRVLLSVDSALLKSSESFRPCHRNSVYAEVYEMLWFFPNFCDIIDGIR